MSICSYILHRVDAPNFTFFPIIFETPIKWAEFFLSTCFHDISLQLPVSSSIITQLNMFQTQTNTSFNLPVFQGKYVKGNWKQQLEKMFSLKRPRISQVVYTSMKRLRIQKTVSGWSKLPLNGSDRHCLMLTGKISLKNCRDSECVQDCSIVHLITGEIIIIIIMFHPLREGWRQWSAFRFCARHFSPPHYKWGQSIQNIDSPCCPRTGTNSLDGHVISKCPSNITLFNSPCRIISPK